MYKLIEVKTKEQIKELYDDSSFTFEGLSVDKKSMKQLIKFFRKKLKKNPEIYVMTGKQMNDYCKSVVKSNKHKDDLTIVSIKLDSFSISIEDLAMVKMQVGARWMDDIIDNTIQCNEELAKEANNER